MRPALLYKHSQSPPHQKDIIVIGGGAAGFFGALACAQTHPGCRVTICEKTQQLLSKVRISGGGRCNVTHHCFEPALLVQNYPRGGKELRGAFSRFQPRDTLAWFESRGVELKVEADGRIFPTTNSSETIINCFLAEAAKLNVAIHLGTAIIECVKQADAFVLTTAKGDSLHCDRLLVATGGNSKTQGWLERLGHSFSPPVPSLFTFNIPHSFLHDLAGVSLPRVTLTLEGQTFTQTGAMLITHWGFSGPAVLKLSAWAARYLYEKKYQSTLIVNWLPDLKIEESKTILAHCRIEHGSRLLSTHTPFELPKNLWKALLIAIGIPSEQRWSMLSKQQLDLLGQTLHHCRFEIEGKSTNKEEFVTCGGVKLEEVNFKTMESRLCPGLYFAGELLDIDGVTGGFNFQSAWTTAWIAGSNL